jgi:hypothetical protein
MRGATWVTIFTTFISFIILPANVLAYCSDPTPPTPPSSYLRPTKPSAPYCVNSFSNTHTCSQYEIDSYNRDLEQYRSDIEDYIRKLKNYVSDAGDFASETVDYANCEIGNLN